MKVAPDDQRGLDVAERWRHNAASQKRKTLALRDVLQDAAEFAGLRRMGWFLIYFTYTIVFVGYNWSENAAAFYSEMALSLQAFGPTDYQQTETAEQLSMASAAAFSTGYVSQLLADSSGRNLPPQEVTINQYVNVQLIRLVTDVQGSCNFGSLHCYQTDPAADQFGATNGTGILPSGVWLPLENPSYYTYGGNPMLYVTLYNKSDTLADYNSMNVTLQRVAEDAAFLGRYSMTLVLEVFATYDQAFEQSDSAACFLLAWSLRGSLFSSSMTFKIQRFMSTVILKTSFFSSFWDVIRLIMLVIYILCIIFYLAEEVDEGRRSALQYATAARRTLAAEARNRTSHSGLAAQDGMSSREERHIRKMVRLGVWRYATSAWNVVDIVGTIVSMIWAFGWIFIVCRSYWASAVYTKHMDSPENLNALLDFSQLYHAFIYIGILNVLLVGLRLYKYMRYHSGMRIYYNLFVSAWRAIKDFAIWFVYVMIVLASVVIMCFQVSGGNARFADRLDGINSMALLTFGVMDYDTFVAGNKGLGAWSPIIIALFWVNVAVLSTIALNIVIAIVSNSYDEAKRREGPVEFTLVYLVWLRLVFSCYWMRRVVLQRWPEERFVQSWVSLVSEEMNMDPHQASHEFRYTASYPWVSMRVAKVFARWSLALLPQTRILVSYFQDAASQSLCARSPWEDAEVVEEALTSAAAVNKRHKPQLPAHKWTIDTAMSRGQFTAFMIGLAASGCAGLPQDSHPRAKDSQAESALQVQAPTAADLKSGEDLLTRSNHNEAQVATSSGPAAVEGLVLDHQDHLNLSAALQAAFDDLDDVMCDLAARGELHGADEQIMKAFEDLEGGKRSVAKLHDKAQPAWGHFDYSADASMEDEREVWRAGGGEPGPSWSARLQDLRAWWSAVTDAWRQVDSKRTQRRQKHLPADKGDLYSRNCASVFVAGATALRASLNLGQGFSEYMRPLLMFRPLLRRRSTLDVWNQHKVAAYYTPWIWEVYSAMLLKDDDWNTDLDDMDLKIIELREALTKAIEDKMSMDAQKPTVSSQGSLTRAEWQIKAGQEGQATRMSSASVRSGSRASARSASARSSRLQ